MAAPFTVHQSDFEGQVHKPLLAKVRALGATEASIDACTLDRLSLVLTSGTSTRGSGGMEKQVALLGDRFPDDPDVQEYSGLPASLFRYSRKDPDKLSRDLAARGLSGCWVTFGDLYPGQKEKPFAALIRINRQLFMRVNASMGSREIVQVDGSLHNCVGLLQVSLVRSLGTGKVLRCSEDPMRFSRDTLAAERTIDACQSARWDIAFGTWLFELSMGATALMTLRSLAQIGQLENELRARKVATHTLSRHKAGLTYLSEPQLPLGVVQARDADGNPLRRLDAFVPGFDAELAPLIEAAVTLHASGADYADIGMMLAEAEAPMKGHRRAGSMGDVLRDPTLTPAAKQARLSSSAKKLFTIGTVRDLPWLHPDHPDATDTDRFFADVYTGKLALWSTGRYVVARNLGVLRGTKDIAGVPVIYLHGSETGHLPLPCNWFVDEHGQSTLPITLDPEVVEASRRRLLRERQDRSPGGGAAHRRERRPWLRDLPSWTDEPYDYTDPPSDRHGTPIPHPAMSHRMIPDTTEDGSATLRCRARPAHQSLTAVGDGWEERAGFGATEGRIVFSISVQELAGDVASQLHAAVGDQLDGQSARLHVGPSPQAEASAILRKRRIRFLEVDVQRAEDRLAGARMSRDEMRGRRARAAGDAVEMSNIATELAATDAAFDEAASAVDLAREALAQVHGEATDLAGKESPPQSVAEASLTTVAYVIAALRRAFSEDGRMSADDGNFVLEHFSDWLFEKETEGVVAWQSRFSWPTRDGRQVSVSLEGSIDNIHRRKGRASGELSQREILAKGRSVDEFLATERVRRNRHGIVVGLDRHLTGHLPRQAISALIDHPVGEARSYVYRRGVLHAPVATPPTWTDEFAEHLLEVYTDPEAEIQKGAAVPQRIDAWHALQLGLLHVGGEAPTDAVARGWGVPFDVALTHLRNQVGFARLTPFIGRKDTTRLLPCPHDDCTNRWASHLCALPEVAVTGFVAICPRCRRVPSLDWEGLELPEEYATVRWTRVVAAKTRPPSVFGPPNPTPAPPPSQNPTSVLCQAQTLEWKGHRLVLPAPPTATTR